MSRVQRIEMTYGNRPLEPAEGLEFVIHTDSTVDDDAPGHVRTYTTDSHAEGMTPVMTSPKILEDEVRRTLRPGVRACIGNAGLEVTFRHVVSGARDNLRQILIWVDEAYKIVGERLVLAPMDYDLLQDAMHGGRLMRWAAERNIPLAIFCGYRFLFPQDAFPHIREFSARHPIDVPSTHYRHPFRQLSRLIRETGAEIWTGAGFHEGLAAGVVERAEAFGMKGVFTSREAWRRYFDEVSSPMGGMVA